MFKLLGLILVLLQVVNLALAQDHECSANSVFNGKACVCSSGYFSSKTEESKDRCEDECGAVLDSYFHYGTCVGNLFKQQEKQPDCDLRCGIRLYWWTTVGILLIFAAALATLFFTIPLCIASCCSCLQARKANKNTKRVFSETQSNPGKDVATMSYNPYAYWPYYGRTQ